MFYGQTLLYYKWEVIAVEWWAIIYEDLFQSSFHGEYVKTKGNHSGHLKWLSFNKEQVLPDVTTY